MLRLALSQIPPLDQDTCLHHPLVWNPSAHMDRGHMLVSQPHVSWGAMAAGPARSLSNWLHFLWFSEDDQR